MSVEVSVREPESAMLDSPQFSGWVPAAGTKFDCNCITWDPGAAVDKLVFEGAKFCKLNRKKNISK